jgi:tetratricopeptide (TPR) repeat protein
VFLLWVGLLAAAACAGYVVALAWWHRFPDPVDLAAEALGPQDVIQARSVEDATTQSELRALKREALDVALGLLADYPDSPEALCVFGLVLSRCGNRDGAVRCWQRCLELAPDYADAWHSLGRDALQRGAFEEAARCLRRALDIDPKMPEALLSLCEALAGLDQLEEALDASTRHLELAPRSAVGWFRRGQIHFRLEQYDEAKRCHERALRLDPEARPVYHALARTCERLGQTREAEKHRQEFARREAKYRAAVDGRRRHEYDDLGSMRAGLSATYLAVAKVYAAHEAWDSAESLWRKACDADPRDVEPRLVLASFNEGRGRLADAQRLGEEAARQEPGRWTHQLQAGVLQARLRRVEAAETSLRKATELAPDQPEAHVALAQVYALEGRNLAAARKEAETAVRLEPTAAHYFILGTVCQRQGDCAAALAALDRARQLDPGSVQYREAYAVARQRQQTSPGDRR